MKTITLTQDWAGKKAGDIVAVDPKRAAYMIDKGLAVDGAQKVQRKAEGRSPSVEKRVTK